MSNAHVLPIRVNRLVFVCRALDELHLPLFAGSTLRGGFGRALRRLVCMTHAPACTGCGLMQSCLYPGHFDSALLSHTDGRTRPVSYAFEPPPIGARAVRPGEVWQFGMRLFGKAIRQAPILVEAMRRTINHGFTTRRSRGTLERVLVARADGLADVYDPETMTLDDLTDEPGITAPTIESGRIKLKLITPLRLQSDGKRIPADAISVARLCRDIRTRAAHLIAVWQDSPQAESRLPNIDPADPARISSTALAWFDWERVSARQGRAMRIGGWLGDLEIENAGAAVVATLALGSCIGIGKETAFGLGQFELQGAVPSGGG